MTKSDLIRVSSAAALIVIAVVRAGCGEHLAQPKSQESLVLRAMPSPAAGETVGDTSQFDAHADWLKTTPTFDAALPLPAVRTKAYANVTFNFPKGGDHD